MAGNKNSKLLVAAGVGAGLLAGGLATYWAYSSTSPSHDHLECHHQGGHRQHEGDRLNPSPVASPTSGIVKDWTPEQLLMLSAMSAQFDKQKQVQGGHLDATFFALLREVVYLRITEKLDATKQDRVEEMAKDFKEMKYTEYNKKKLQLAIELNAIEEDEQDKITDTFDDPVFIQASRIYLLRYNPDPYLHDLVVGAKAQHKAHLKLINQFNLKDVLAFVRSRIEKRSEQGFEFVDKSNFVTEFRLQLETEVLAKFEARLDEVWAFCALESLGEDKPLWEATVQDYLKMLKTFFQSQTLYYPGIKITGN